MYNTGANKTGVLRKPRNFILLILVWTPSAILWTKKVIKKYVDNVAVGRKKVFEKLNFTHG